VTTGTVGAAREMGEINGGEMLMTSELSRMIGKAVEKDGMLMLGIEKDGVEIDGIEIDPGEGIDRLGMLNGGGARFNELGDTIERFGSVIDGGARLMELGIDRFGSLVDGGARLMELGID